MRHRVDRRPSSTVWHKPRRAVRGKTRIHPFAEGHAPTFSAVVFQCRCGIPDKVPAVAWPAALIRVRREDHGIPSIRRLQRGHGDATPWRVRQSARDTRRTCRL